MDARMAFTHPLIAALQAQTQTAAPTIGETVEVWVKIAAILAAGVWTYLIFVRQRQRYPRAQLRQTAVTRVVSDRTRVLTVGIALTNIGQRLIEIDYVSIVVQRLAPLKPGSVESALSSHNPMDSSGRREILWYRVGHRRTGFLTGQCEVEPGEAEEMLFDFAIPLAIAVIKVDAHVENRFKRGVRAAIRRGLARLPFVSVTNTNRCLGWRSAAMYNLPLATPLSSVLTNTLRHEDSNDRQG